LSERDESGNYSYAPEAVWERALRKDPSLRECIKSKAAARLKMKYEEIDPKPEILIVETKSTLEELAARKLTSIHSYHQALKTR
jgi:hypothetical protein